MSFLITPDALHALLEHIGFRLLAWKDTTEVSRRWYLAALDQRRTSGPPPLGLHMLLGPSASAKFANVAKNLVEERITVFQGLLEKV
jgi:hypothetical protein